jgi:signal transduction histidine kinase
VNKKNNEGHTEKNMKKPSINTLVAPLVRDLIDNADALRVGVAKGSLAELRHLEHLAASLAEDLRRLSHQLHPSIIYHLGLPAALRSLVEEFQRSCSGTANFKAGEFPDELPPDVAAALYRITQEALRNVTKHAPAAPVGVLLVREPGGLRLTIEDKGPGFDPEAVRGQGGLGIISMRERTQILGGNLLVQSAPGQGTRIEVRVPVKR